MRVLVYACIVEVAMALKDLVAEKDALDEAAIERIISAFVRYDVGAKAITFTPTFTGISIKAKILVYLVALRGWKFVLDEVAPNDARPSDIEAATGIPGGSLRPALSSLRDSHLIAEKDSRYSVRGTSFPIIEKELTGEGEHIAARHSRPTVRKPARNGRRANVSKSDANLDEPDNGAKKTLEATEEIVATKRPRKIVGKTGNLAATFDRWITEGYFDEPRTLSEVQGRFRKEAILVQQTSLPGYFLGAVRSGRLTRDEVNANGKTVWAYTTNKTKAG